MKWIDKKSSLIYKKEIYKAGDTIPAGVLSQARIDALVKQKKISIGNEIKDGSKKSVKILGADVEAQVMGKSEPTPEPEKSKRFGKKKEVTDDSANG